MKLIEAIEINRTAEQRSQGELRFALVCGFEPLHLRSFLTAYLNQANPGRKVVVETGLFGDLAGNLERLRPQELAGAAVVLEWSDLDPRLGMRQLAAATPETQADILTTVRMSLARAQAALSKLPESCPAALCPATLALPPLGLADGFRAAGIEVALRAQIADFEQAAASLPGVRLVSSENLNAVSPHGARRDVASELSHGFPYSTTHADALGKVLARVLRPPARKKGLITDLDGTFWRGILGEDGVAGVQWSLAGRAQAHGIYQQLLKLLASRGILLAVASKNDAQVVEEAFRRPDLACPGAHIFPFQVHWRPKSESVSEILRTWNIAADAVVFVDDSPIELAEVKSAHPDVECLLFPQDATKLLPALESLCGWFGTATVEREDAIRLESIRSAAAWRDAEAAPEHAFEEFLSRAEARLTVTVGKSEQSRRPFELVNKTNQFNLNGKRYSEADWSAAVTRPGSFVAAVDYTDKFGPLGVILAAVGEADSGALALSSWVMSCRAFGRRIEHQFVSQLFETFDVDRIRFDYAATSRNGPVRDFLAQFDLPDQDFCLTREKFFSACPALFHSVELIRI
jgi:FkbH-like protein